MACLYTTGGDFAGLLLPIVHAVDWCVPTAELSAWASRCKDSQTAIGEKAAGLTASFGTLTSTVKAELASPTSSPVLHSLLAQRPGVALVAVSAVGPRVPDLYSSHVVVFVMSA